MRSLIFALALATALPATAQSTAQTAQTTTDANGRKLVPARRCLVYEDDPEAATYVKQAAARTTPPATTIASAKPLVLPKSHAATRASTTKTTARAKPSPAVPASKAPAPILTAAVSVPPRPNAAADVAPAPYSANPIQQLRGNARVLLVFAPAADSPIMQQQMLMIERHQLDLAHRNTVLVPILNPDDSRTFSFNGEHLDPGTAADLAAARQKFNIKPTEFAVVLLDDHGIERTRWSEPVSATDLDDQIDAIDDDAGIVHQLNAR